MDQWYVLFGLIGLIYTDKYVRENLGRANLAMVFACCSLALLSKETAIVLPGAMALFFFANPGVIKSSRFWIALAVWSLPIAVFIAFRFQGMAASFSNPSAGSYAASLSNVPENVLIYFAYPFLFLLGEAGNWVFVDNSFMIFAVAFHVVLVGTLFLLFGIRGAAGYLAMYFICLAPILLIPSKFAHYLYGSSLVLSAAVILIAIEGFRRNFAYVLIAVASALMLTVHSFVLQSFVYSIGKCMDSAMKTTESAHLSAGRPTLVEFKAEPGAPAHVLHRFVTGRSTIGASFPVSMSISKWDTPYQADALALIMDGQCRVYVKPK
jgi:hypothetical protein